MYVDFISKIKFEGGKDIDVIESIEVGLHDAMVIKVASDGSSDTGYILTFMLTKNVKDRAAYTTKDFVVTLPFHSENREQAFRIPRLIREAILDSYNNKGNLTIDFSIEDKQHVPVIKGE